MVAKESGEVQVRQLQAPVAFIEKGCRRFAQSGLRAIIARSVIGASLCGSESGGLQRQGEIHASLDPNTNLSWRRTRVGGFQKFDGLR